MKLTVGKKGTKNSKKSTKKGKVSKEANPNVLVCESSGKKVKFSGGVNEEAILAGEERVFSSRELAVEHMRMEKARGCFLVHRNAVFADPKKNVRRFSTRATEFLDLMESIKSEGILQPLMVQRSLDNKPAMYVLRAGFRRFEASRRLDIDLIPITIIDDSVSPKVAGILENLREDMKPLEMATAIKAIMSEKVKSPKTGKMKKPSQRDVSKMLGISQSKVSDLLGIVSDLHPKVSQAVTSGEIPVSKAALIKQLPSKSQLKALKLAADIDVRDLRKHVQEEREKAGDLPRHQGKDDRKKKVKNRKFKTRPVGELIDACLAAEKVYFTEKRTKSNRLVASVFQFILGILDSPNDSPIDPAEIERKLEAEAEEKKQQRLENLKKGREKKAAANAKKGKGKTKPAKKKGAAKKANKAKPKLPKPKSKKKK